MNTLTTCQSSHLECATCAQYDAPDYGCRHFIPSEDEVPSTLSNSITAQTAQKGTTMATSMTRTKFSDAEIEAAECRALGGCDLQHLHNLKFWCASEHIDLDSFFDAGWSRTAGLPVQDAQPDSDSQVLAVSDNGQEYTEYASESWANTMFLTPEAYVTTMETLNESGQRARARELAATYTAEPIEVVYGTKRPNYGIEVQLERNPLHMNAYDSDYGKQTWASYAETSQWETDPLCALHREDERYEQYGYSATAPAIDEVFTDHEVVTVNYIEESYEYDGVFIVHLADGREFLFAMPQWQFDKLCDSLAVKDSITEFHGDCVLGLNYRGEAYIASAA